MLVLQRLLLSLWSGLKSSLQSREDELRRAASYLLPPAVAIVLLELMTYWLLNSGRHSMFVEINASVMLGLLLMATMGLTVRACIEYFG